MFLTQLSRAEGVLCHQRFKRPAYAVDDFTGDGAIQAGYAEEDYADEGFGYASWKEDYQQRCFILVVTDYIYVIILLAVVPQTWQCNIYNLVTVNSDAV